MKQIMHYLSDRGADAYFTPPCAVRSLIALEKIPVSVADPCCGSGAILDALKDSGHIVHGRDIVDYGWPCTVIADYLAEPIEMAYVTVPGRPGHR